jgi:hypothetical protein
MLNCRSRLASVRSLALVPLLAAALTLGACSSGTRSARHGDVTAAAPVGAFSLDRGDWLVGTETGVWLVEVPGEATGSAAPVRIGYVVGREHRQVRGGPAFTVYEVTTLDRHNTIGIVDSVGNAKRFKPRRGGNDEVEDAGNSTLAYSVQSIFEIVKPVSLVPTTESRLSFEVLDTNHDGFLDKSEFPRIGSPHSNPDTNHDGKVDPGEFDAAEDL